MANPYVIPSIISFIIQVSIAVYIFRKDIKKDRNHTFAFLTICFAWWAFFEAMVTNSTSSASAFLFSKVLYVGVFFIAPAWVDFCLTFVKLKIPRLILYFPSVLLTIYLFKTDLIISGVTKLSYSFYREIGVMYLAFVIYLVFYLCYGIVHLGIQYEKTPKSIRRPIFVTFIGLAVMLVSGISTNVIFPLINLASPFGTMMMTIGLAVIAYSFRFPAK